MNRSKIIGVAASAIAATTMLLPASAQASARAAVPVHAAAAPVQAISARQLSIHGSAQIILRAPNATVSPRVDCGGFNGHISWDSQDVSVWGQLWESCGATSYLYVSYKDPTGANWQIGSVSHRGTAGINWSITTVAAPGYISVTVCSNHIKWHCGTPQQV
jgi:hypothetical protein